MINLNSTAVAAGRVVTMLPRNDAAQQLTILSTRLSSGQFEDGVLHAGRGRISSGNVLGDRWGSTESEAQDARVWWRGTVCPGGPRRTVSIRSDVGTNVQRTCCCRVWHDVHRWPPVSTFQLRRHWLTTSLPPLLLLTHSFWRPTQLHALRNAG